MGVKPAPTNPNLPAPMALRSMLVIECRPDWTAATLFGMVEGHCRLLARDQAPTALDDLGSGFRQAVQRIEQLTGYRLLAQQRIAVPETATGEGVDGVALVVSAAPPLCVALRGPGRDHWQPIIQRILATLATIEAPAATPRAAPEPDPDMILLLGLGSDAAPDDAQRAAWHAAAHQIAEQVLSATATERAPAVVMLASEVEQALVSDTLAGLEVVAVTPTASRQPGKLAQIIADVDEQRSRAPLPGYAQARDAATRPPLSAATALGRFARFVGQRYATHVVVVDIGADATLALGADPQGKLFASQAYGIGLRQGAGAVVRGAGMEHFARWLPESLTLDALEALEISIAQRMLIPQLVAETRAELDVDAALARAAVRLLLEQATSGGMADLPRIDILIGAGQLLATVPNPGEAALILLDGVQPRGICQIVIDVAQIAPALGAASLLDSIAAADAVDVDALLMQLGTCVSAVGMPPEGQAALRAVLEYADGHRHVAEVLPGTIERLPLGVGQRARLLLYPAPGVDVGLGPGERAFAGEPIEGGRLGVIIDARGRPLELPAEPEQRRALLRQWRAALTL